MNILLVTLVGAVVAVVLGFGRIALEIRRGAKGPEREELNNSLWSMAGVTALILSIAIGEPLLSFSVTAQWILLGGAAGLIATGGIKSRRLAATRKRELLGTLADGATLVDRIEALEVERSLYHRVPLGRQIGIIGGKVMIAGTALWALRLLQHPTAYLIFGPLAAASIGWLGWDLVSAIRRKAERDRIDGEIAGLLEIGTRPETGGAEERP